MSPEPHLTWAGAAELATALALGRHHHRGRPWGRPAQALLEAAAGIGKLQPIPPALTFSPTPSSNARRVLLTDRDGTSAGSLAEACRRAGFDARSCSDGAVALLETTEFRPHACVLDLETPVVGGCELAQWVRSEVSEEVFLVGLIDPVIEPLMDDVDSAAMAGFQLVLNRPVDAELLVGILSGHRFRTGA